MDVEIKKENKHEYTEYKYFYFNIKTNDGLAVDVKDLISIFDFDKIPSNIIYKYEDTDVVNVLNGVPFIINDGGWTLISVTGNSSCYCYHFLRTNK